VGVMPNGRNTHGNPDKINSTILKYAIRTGFNIVFFENRRVGFIQKRNYIYF